MCESQWLYPPVRIQDWYTDPLTLLSCICRLIQPCKTWSMLKLLQLPTVFILTTIRDLCQMALSKRPTLWVTSPLLLPLSSFLSFSSRLLSSNFCLLSNQRNTSDYVQVTGTYDWTKMNLNPYDCGGEYDNHGALGLGNPVGAHVDGGDVSFFLDSFPLFIR